MNLTCSRCQNAFDHDGWAQHVHDGCRGYPPGPGGREVVVMPGDVIVNADELRTILDLAATVDDKTSPELTALAIANLKLAGHHAEEAMRS